MTQEDKELLLKDLCARLPYGVKIHINSPIEEQNYMELFDVNIDGETIGVGNDKWAFRAVPIIDDEDETKVVKPYLRPMSSMTEEEVKEIRKISWQFCKPKNNLDECFVGAADDGYCSISQMADILNYLNAHYFDYRGLIEKGLALESPEGMYKTE